MNRIASLVIATFSISAMLLGCSGGGSSSGSAGGGTGGNGNTSSIIQLWESHMVQFGRQLCDRNTIADLGTFEGNVWYYDGIRTFYQIAEYTGDRSWDKCAEYVRDVYRPYVLQNSGKIPGWRVFPHGLQLDFMRTGDTNSQHSAMLLASDSAFAAQGGGADPELSRETAYLIHAYITQQELGGGINPHRNQSVEYALGHLDRWTDKQSTGYVKPFMVGLTFEALIHYYNSVNRDVRILNAIQIAADWLWDHAWVDSAQSFQYIVCKPAVMNSNRECKGPDAGPAPDLNLLIAPGFAWLYSETHDELYKQRAEAIFAGGVQFANLGDGKRFNQNYRWSFDAVKWLIKQ